MLQRPRVRIFYGNKDKPIAEMIGKENSEIDADLKNASDAAPEFGWLHDREGKYFDKVFIIVTDDFLPKSAVSLLKICVNSFVPLYLFTSTPFFPNEQTILSLPLELRNGFLGDNRLNTNEYQFWGEILKAVGGADQFAFQLHDQSKYSPKYHLQEFKKCTIVSCVSENFQPVKITLYSSSYASDLPVKKVTVRFLASNTVWTSNQRCVLKARGKTTLELVKTAEFTQTTSQEHTSIRHQETIIEPQTKLQQIEQLQRDLDAEEAETRRRHDEEVAKRDAMVTKLTPDEERQFEYDEKLCKLELMRLDLRRKAAAVLKQREEEKIQLENSARNQALLEEEGKRQREANAILEQLEEMMKLLETKEAELRKQQGEDRFNTPVVNNAECTSYKQIPIMIVKGLSNKDKASILASVQRAQQLRHRPNTDTISSSVAELQNELQAITQEKNKLQHSFEKIQKELISEKENKQKVYEEMYINEKAQLEKTIKFLQNQLESPALYFGVNHDKLQILKQEKLGSGSFGTVYRGYYYKTPVAVKELNEKQRSAKAKQFFKREAEILAQLKHPNIISCFGFSIDNDSAFIVLQLMDQSLDSWIAAYPGNRIPYHIVTRMAKEMCMGMNYLHSLSVPIIHRDLKSPNILLDKNLQVKITDFGISKMTLTTTVKMGAKRWSAPEYWDYKQTKGVKGDVYSFGVILWELLTKQLPWDDIYDEDEIGQILLDGKSLEVPVSVPKKFRDILEKCWQLDQESRPSFEALIDSFTQMESSQTYSIAFILSLKHNNIKLIMKLFDSILDEDKTIFVKRELFITSEDYSAIKDFDFVCPILTKDCLADPKFAEAITIAHSNKKRIFLIYDICSAFPSADQQPQAIKNMKIFDAKAISLIPGYYDRVWRQLVSKTQQNSEEVEDVSSEIFLSHAQATAQDCALALWSNLEREHPGKIFLDVQTDFNIHNLDLIVSKTNLFVLIVSNGLFDRPWCKIEYESALKNKKKIIVVKHYKYNPSPGDAEPWPGVKKMLDTEQYILYSPEVVKNCVKRILLEL